jgi:hypothetical protein
MPINAPITSTIDIRLPLDPENVDDPKVYRDLKIAYDAIRNLQAAINPTVLFNPINNTGAAVDLALGVGQVCFIDFVGVSSIPLSVATQDGQEYEISYIQNQGPQSNNTLLLKPNNLTYGSAIGHTQWYADVSAFSTTGGGTLEGNFLLSIGYVGANYHTISRVTTRLAEKTCFSSGRGAQPGIAYMGFSFDLWADTTTKWTSLGTINSVDSLTGRVYVRRLS